MDIDALWHYDNPALSEEKFRAALDTVEGGERLELQTQIARTYSLRKQFDKAHTILDEVVAQLNDSTVKANIRYLLERGRAYNSSGKVDIARQHFLEAWDAWEKGQEAELSGLAVDAAHMVAITHGGSAEGIAWNQKAIALAESSIDPKAKGLLAALFNNVAWDLFDLGRSEEALEYFRKAESAWEAKERPKNIHIAKWSVARCLRSLEQHQEALAILFDLEEKSWGTHNGFVYEELVENLLILNDQDKAQSYAQKAYDILKEDDWFVKNEAKRFSRLESISKKDS